MALKKTPIRILYFYTGPNANTGSPKVLLQMTRGLDRDRFEPLFFSTRESPLAEAMRALGVEIVPGTVASLTYRQPLAGLRAILRQAKRLKQLRVDLVHVNEFGWNQDLVLAAGALRIPVILHVHNPGDIAFQNLNRIAASKVLFCSRAVMNEFGRTDRVAAKAEVLYNTIDTAALGNGRSIRRELGLGEKDIAIGTVAQVRPGKGIDIVIEVARRMLAERNDLVFLIAGPDATGEAEAAARLRDAARAPALQGRVRFLGPRNDIPDILASLDVFLLPTRAEAFGIAVLEALAAGLPVIASRVGGIPEMIDSPEVGFLVHPITAESFAETLRAVLALPDRGRRVGEKARLHAAVRFDVRAGAEHLARIYLDLKRPGP
jgi:glycosyltransferase involved in cell wall biosynthesis